MKARFLTFTVCLTAIGFVSCTQPDREETAEGEHRGITDHPNPERPRAIPEKEFTATGSDGAPTVFQLALDRAVVRLPGGTDRLVTLDPPATTPSDLPRRLAEMQAGGEVHPVCHPEEHPGRTYVITRDITVRLSPYHQDLPLPPGLKVKERPAYAPDHVVLTAADPFAALAAVEGLRDSQGVASAEVQLAKQQHHRTLPNDPLISDQWHLKQSGSSAGTDINIESTWNYGGTVGIRGNGVVIGVVDDGVQTAHPDLVGNIDTINGWDWNGEDDNPNPANFDDDHGTACAGVAAARGNNGIGVSGVAPEATLVGMRLIGAVTTDTMEADAMAYLPDLIDIKSNSWGPEDNGYTLEAPGSLTRAAFASAAANGRGGLGTIFTWAAGNGLGSDDNSNYDGYANDIHTIAVTAIDSLGRQAYYAEPGANILIAAPSDGSGSALGITTTDRTGSSGYEFGDYASDFGGTSSATPVVSGVVALMLEKNPGLGWRDVQEILIRSAAKIQPADGDWVDNAAGFHFNHKFGAGLVDATAAVSLAETWIKLPAASTETRDLGGVSIAIPDDNPAGITRTFDFSGSELRCEHVTLTFTANHTSRGDLTVTLISPSGTESRLAEAHDDTANHYSAWTFSSVRHWGEIADGIWTLKVTDEVELDAGSLTGATLTLHGVTEVDFNPPPVVSIDSPSDGAVFSPGTEVDIAFTATDLTADGETGTITSIELLDDGVPVVIDPSPPFALAFSPAEGEHILTIRATDDEGASRISDAVTISIRNQAPVSYENWIATFATGFTQRDDDPDGDGLANLIEYYLGSDPTTAGDGLAITLVDEEWMLVFNHLKASSEATATVEWSDDLLSWSDAGVTLEVTAEDTEAHTFRAHVPAGTGQRFVRLRVE